LPQGNYRFRADQGGAQYWSDSTDDCMVPGCTGVTVTLAPTSGMVPKGLLSFTAYQPGSDTAMIQASWIMPAGAQIVSDGPVSAQSATQRKTSNLSLSPKLAPSQAILPAWGMQKTQQETPGLLLSSPNAPSFDPNPTQTTISYTYDSLYRLTDAVYSNGFEFHYTYDPVGNRLTQTTCAPGVPCSTTTYEYDPANRLIAVNGQAYKWDDNGNLLDDGTSQYAYDTQNRLMSLTQGGHSYAFSYNGNGDRLTQSVDGAVTRYTLDLEAGLTQVLSDGGYAYLYGADRLAQVSSSETDYFLGDALGSVRQLVDVGGAVKLAQNYDPYGKVMRRAGNGTSTYGFDGEQQNGALVYLRLRYLDSLDGRFLNADSSMYSWNLFTYAKEDPINNVDPTGACWEPDPATGQLIEKPGVPPDNGTCGTAAVTPTAPTSTQTPTPASTATAMPAQIRAATQTAAATSTGSNIPAICHQDPMAPGCGSYAGNPVAAPVTGWNWLKGYTEPLLRAKTQNQLPDYENGCAIFSMAMAINLVTGGDVSGADLAAWMELSGHRTGTSFVGILLGGHGDIKVNIGGNERQLAIGVMPDEQVHGLNDLFDLVNCSRKLPPLIAELKTGGTAQDLIRNIGNGYPTIVSVSWGAYWTGWPTDPGVGHAMVVVGHNPASNQFAFLDPAGGELVKDFSRDRKSVV
jgi:RHS repeat-associated protein